MKGIMIRKALGENNKEITGNVIKLKAMLKQGLGKNIPDVLFFFKWVRCVDKKKSNIKRIGSRNLVCIYNLC